MHSYVTHLYDTYETTVMFLNRNHLNATVSLHCKLSREKQEHISTISINKNAILIHSWLTAVFFLMKEDKFTENDIKTKR